MIAVLAEPGSIVAGREIELAEEEAHHLKVRRAENEAALRVLDGAGVVGTGTLRWEGKRARLLVGTSAMAAPIPPLTLAVGAGDKERFGWLVEKAGELGVTDLVPLETEHTRAVATRVRDAHIDKFNQRARETLKQSTAAWAPKVHSLTELDAFAAARRTGLLWLAQPGGDPPPSSLSNEAVAVVIGPEGGWAGPELDRLLAARFQAIALATPILRFETAALAAASVVAVARLRGARD